jgi:hypothetical protein
VDSGRFARRINGLLLARAVKRFVGNQLRFVQPSAKLDASVPKVLSGRVLTVHALPMILVLSDNPKGNAGNIEIK